MIGHQQISDILSLEGLGFLQDGPSSKIASVQDSAHICTVRCIAASHKDEANVSHSEVQIEPPICKSRLHEWRYQWSAELRHRRHLSRFDAPLLHAAASCMEQHDRISATP